ncbi:hypothetical protein [Arthrobacter globiformis]|uniref:hypothetical protein n=1 Tax=Arthrobacter globiformis TaxID=1665 RepID=UPI002791A263|nr:hypothetical protein [Arthrobacter globiformis]MDQ0618115.1 hypothetical protein [Arthrobacter globiformis]
MNPAMRRERTALPFEQGESIQALNEDRPLSGMLEVNVKTAADVDQDLEDAIARITEAAKRHETGVMVTRIGPGSYIVRAHPAVPYGLIRQQHE